MGIVKFLASSWTAAVLAAAGAHAQHATAQLSWSGGTFGKQLELELQGDPGESYLLFFNQLQGPGGGPLPYVVPFPGPSGPLAGAVAAGGSLPGPALQSPLASQTLGVLNAVTGAATLTVNLFDPQLLGTVWGAQFATLDAAGAFDDLSNAVQFTIAAPGTSFFTSNGMAQPVRNATVTELANGRLLVAGGLDPANQPVAAWQLFDPLTESFLQPPALPGPRAGHTATPLANGQVLILGGIGAPGLFPGSSVLASGLVYNPRTDSFQATPPMSLPRIHHTATLLEDGRVLVAGGSGLYEPDHPLGFPFSMQAGSLIPTTEIFDPATGTWSPGPLLPMPLTGHQASRLGDGKVLLTGGLERNLFGVVLTTDRCWLYNPRTNGFSAAPPLPDPVAFHAQVETDSGAALVMAGGELNLATTAVTYPENVTTFDGVAWTLHADIPGIGFAGCCRCNHPVYHFSGGLRLDRIDDVSVTTITSSSALYSLDAAFALSSVFSFNKICTNWSESFDLGQRFLNVAYGELPGGAIETRGEVLVICP